MTIQELVQYYCNLFDECSYLELHTRYCYNDIQNHNIRHKMLVSTYEDLEPNYLESPKVWYQNHYLGYKYNVTYLNRGSQRDLEIAIDVSDVTIVDNVERFYQYILQIASKQSLDILVISDIRAGVAIITKSDADPYTGNLNISYQKFLDLYAMTEAEWRYGRESDVVVCAIARSEFKFIKEWVEWNLKIGFDHVYIWDNNRRGEERYDDLLRPYIIKNQVRILDARDKVAYQTQAYKDFYNTYKFDWVAVIDCDEFITFSESCKYQDVKTFVHDFSDYNSIRIMWQCYKSPTTIDYSKPIREQCTEPISRYVTRTYHAITSSLWEKSFYKSGIEDLDCNEHFGFNTNAYSYFKPKDDSWTYPSDVTDITINHYLIRGIDDFFNNKIKRGHAGTVFSIDDDKPIYTGWRHDWNYYTDFQEFLTREDQEYLKRHGYALELKFLPIVYVKNFAWMSINPHIGAYVNDRLVNLMERADIRATIHFKTLDDLNYYGSWDDPEFKNHLSYNGLNYASLYVYDFDNNISYSSADTRYQNSIYVNIGSLTHLDDVNMHTDSYVDMIRVNFEKLTTTFFDPKQFTDICRQILEQDESKSFIICPKDSVVCDEHESNHEQAITQFLKDHDIKRDRRMRIVGNTYITNLSTQKIITDTIDAWFRQYGYLTNTEIDTYHKSDIYTHYDAAHYIYPNLVDEIIII